MLIFTDLDGTLLDAGTYDWRPARPALALAAARGIPVVFATSKTRAETEYWRAATGNTGPFVFENGGGIVARGRLTALGAPYRELVAALSGAVAAAGVPARGFASMTAADVALASGLELSLAALAKLRFFDEPFEVLEPEGAGRLLAAIESAGYCWSRGGRFYHIHGRHDKAKAAGVLAGMIADHPGPPLLVGIGDAMNDAGLLNAVDIPILIRSPHTEALARAVPHGRVTELAGPAGWNRAVLDLLQSTGEDAAQAASERRVFG